MHLTSSLIFSISVFKKKSGVLSDAECKLIRVGLHCMLDADAVVYGLIYEKPCSLHAKNCCKVPLVFLRSHQPKAHSLGELIVYRDIRRPSVCQSSIRHSLSTFSKHFFSETVKPIIFILHIYCSTKVKHGFHFRLNLSTDTKRFF